MNTRDKHIHIALLYTAELQFRLASAVSLATTTNVQPLDLPMEWTHGQHRVKYEEIALRPDQADYAAFFLQRSATFLLAVAMKDAIPSVVPDPKASTDTAVRCAYQIARLIRNAFAHAPFSPTWSIDADCCDKVFAVPDVITLDTTGLHGTAFDWRHYGGPLALFRLSQFVRIAILKDEPTPRNAVPLPRASIYQIGDLILRKVDEIPEGAGRGRTACRRQHPAPRRIRYSPGQEGVKTLRSPNRPLDRIAYSRPVNAGVKALAARPAATLA